MEADTEQQDDTGKTPLHNTLKGYYTVAQLCSTEVSIQQRAMVESLTLDELDRIATRKRLNEDAIFLRIASKLQISVEDVSDAVFRLRFFWREGCKPMPKKYPPTTAHCNLCRERVESVEGCCQYCRSRL